jgi:hypothetical protein
LKHLTRQPLFWLIAHCEISAFGRLPLNDGSFHQARVGKQKGLGCHGICHAGLLIGTEFSPAGAFAVDHGFPVKCFQPAVQGFFRQTLLFEIVKNILKTLIGQPSSGFFDGVAVGDAVKGDAGVFNEVLSVDAVSATILTL